MVIDKNNIYALIIGKKKSTGFPGKNVMNINGQPSCEYGFQVAKRIGIKNIFWNYNNCFHWFKNSNWLLGKRIILENKLFFLL